MSVADTTRPVRVALVEDEPLIRAGLRTILESDAEIRVVLEHADGLGVVPAVRGARCDVVLMDVRMPGRTGLDALADLHAAGITARVIVLTTFADAEYLRRAVELTVDGYLLKTAAPAEIIAAVRTVHDGGVALSPLVARWLMDAATGPIRDRSRARAAIGQLTERQREVLLGIARGQANAAIARDLHLAASTVKGYVSEVLEQLGCDRRVQAAALAQQAGLLSSSTET